MSKTDLEEKLQKLRSLYLENHSTNPVEDHLFTPLSREEKEQRILEKLKECTKDTDKMVKKIKEFSEENENSSEVADLKNYLETLRNRKIHLDQKLTSLQNDDFDIQRRERVKRQLLDLELKRAKLLLGRKDCSKIEQKIKQKAQTFKSTK